MVLCHNHVTLFDFGCLAVLVGHRHQKEEKEHLLIVLIKFFYISYKYNLREKYYSTLIIFITDVKS